MASCSKVSKKLSWLLVLIVLAVVISPVPAPRAAGQEVVLNPGYISGNIQMGGVPNTAYISAYWSGQSASTTSTGNYTLTVNVPQGQTVNYNVSASGYFNSWRDYINFGYRSVPVTEFQTSTVNWGTANPGLIQGTVSVKNQDGTPFTGSYYASVYAYQSSTTNYTNSQTSAYPSDTALCTGTGSAGSYCMPVMPNTNIQVYGFVYVGSSYYPLSYQYVAVAGGGTATVNWTVTHIPPPPSLTGSIAGTISTNGSKAANYLSVQAYSAGSSRYQYFYNTNSSPYLLADLNVGTAWMNANAYYDNYIRYFYYPNSSFSPTRQPTVSPGQTTTVNIAANQAFINGTFSIAGTNRLSETYNVNYNAYGMYSTQSYGGGASTQVNKSTGAYEFVLSEGSWIPYYWSTSWYRPDPATYLASNLTVYDYANLNSPIPLTAGQTVTRNLSYKTGNVTVTFRVLGGGTLSSPRLSGSCYKNNESSQLIWYYYFNASNFSQQNVTVGSVTFVGLEGTCTVTPQASVNGSWVTFSPLTVNVIPGVGQVIDIGGPTLTVQNPQPDQVLTSSPVTVSGRVTDDVQVASVTVNGLNAALTSTNNPNDPKEMAFSASIPLSQGANQIKTIATDISGKTASDTRTVYLDLAPPSLLGWAPADGSVTGSSIITVQGKATNDVGIASITVNGASTSFFSTSNPLDPIEVSFSTTLTLAPGTNTITVVVTDKAGRTTSETHIVTLKLNKPPVAVDDTATTDEDTPVTIKVLTNDSDPDGDPLKVSFLGPAGHGTVIINLPDNSVTYTPNPNFFGSDSFLYRASDGAADSNVAWVTVTVQEKYRPIKEDVIVQLHTIDQSTQGGTAVTGISGAIVRVYDRDNNDFRGRWGGKNPKGELYPDIWANEAGQVAECITDAQGKATCREKAPGNYLIIVRYVDNSGKEVFAGKPKSLEEKVDRNGDGIADPIQDTNGDGILDANGDWTDTNSDGVIDSAVAKEFPILKVIRKTGEIQLGRGSKRVVTGSYLEVIYPEYAVWESGSSSYVYPFIFTSDSDWTVNVCAEVPSGYKVVGVYDAQGNLVSSSQCVQTGVTGEKKVVAFEVQDLKSPPPDFKGKFTVHHKGKVTKFDLTTPGHRKGKDKPGNGHQGAN